MTEEIDEVGRAFRHSPATATRAQRTPLARSTNRGTPPPSRIRAAAARKVSR